MASINDSSLIFFSKATPAQWSFVLNLYRDVFRTHAEQTRGSRKNGPADLIKLDIWFQDQLPQIIRSRQESQLLYEELVQITKWKLFRGKFRPSLLDLVKTNTETAVKNVTKKAFKKMPNISSAITALTQLKGIGPATASAILVAHSPDLLPFMADETMISIVEVNDYTLAEYLNYVEKIEECVDKLRKQDADGDWTPHKIELALWTHYQIKQYNLNSLNSMPSAGEEVSNSSNQQLAGSADESNQISNSDENQVDSSFNGEINLNCISNIDTSNSNLIDSNNSPNNDESSLNHILDNSSSGFVNVSQSNHECNELSSSSSKHHDKNISTNVRSVESNIVSNSESNLVGYEDSNLSSMISSNSSEELAHSNKLIVVEEDSSSNNVSSTNVNGLIQSTSGFHSNRIANGKESSSTTNDELSNSDHQINSSLINKHLNSNQINVDSNLSPPITNDSSISSSCENSNNVNSSEDSILELINKKRSNSSSSSSSNVVKKARCLNCNEALVNLDDNAVPDSESLSKRQKSI